MSISFRHYWRLLATYLRPQWRAMSLLTLLLFGGIGLQLVNPQIVRFFIDATQGGAAQGVLLTAAGLFLGIALVQRLAGIATTYVGENVGWRATNALRGDLALHVLRLDMQFHQRRTPGELIERIDGDVTALANFFSQLVIKVVGNGLLIIGILLLLFLEDWRLGLGLSLYALLTLVALASLQRVSVARWAAVSQIEAEQASFLEERMSGTEDLRANGAEPYVMRRFFELMRRRLHAFGGAFLINNLNFGLTQVCYVLGYALGLGLGVYLFTQGQITIGTVYLIIAYIALLSAPLQQIREQVTDLQQATASMGRVEELFRTDQRVHEQPSAALPSGPLAVAFARVGFSYEDQELKEPRTKNQEPRTEAQEPKAQSQELETQNVAMSAAVSSEAANATVLGSQFSVLADSEAVLGSQPSVLHAIDFALAPGRVLGVLGRTGSGKTTLTRLIFRLYDPQAGAVTLGGHDLRSLSLADLRSHVGMVTQDVQLFRASVRDNLTLFSKEIGDERILAVLREVGLWEWYAALPDGLDTELAAGGAGLSAGQAQLLAFARVFLKDPGLVVLDEASSRLDPATERLLERAIDRLFEQRTGIIIAHRLGTVQRADDILILDRGRVVEYGPRAQLAADPHSRFAQLLRTGLEEALA